MTPATISGNLAAMGFLSQVRQDLQQSLADQQRLAVLQVLRKRAATLTCDDLRQLLASPLGKGLGPMLLVDVLGVSTTAPAPTEPEKPKATSNAPVRKKKTSTRKAAKKRQKPSRPRRARHVKTTGSADGSTATATPRPARKTRSKAKSTASPAQTADGADRTTATASPARKTRSKAKSAVAPGSAAKPSPAHGPDWRPPGMSPEQAAEMARYGESVHAIIRQAGDWIAASEIRDQVGKSPEQLRLALRKLETSGDIVRTGQRGHTRYRAAVAR